MEPDNYVFNPVLGEMGCRFRSIIENHIKDDRLQEGCDFEWLLEPLDAISHSADIVLDVFQYGSKWESFYKLYFHNKNASDVYVPFDRPLERPNGVRIEENTIHFLEPDEIEERPSPNPYSKTMLIKGTPEENAMADVPGIWEDLTVQFSEIGIWQVILLNEIKSLFPKGWHGNYIEKTYVFSKTDMRQIIDSKKGKYDFTDEEIERLDAYWRFLDMPSHFYQFKKSNFERLESFLNQEDIMPSVKINGDKAVVSYCFWNDWSGFCQAVIPVDRCGQSVSIGQSNNKVLVPYDCGIRY